MKQIYDQAEIRIDRITLAEELMKRGQLESVDGLSYLISLDEEPARNIEPRWVCSNCEGQIGPTVDHVRRAAGHESQLIGEEDPDEIIGDAYQEFLQLGHEMESGTEIVSTAQLIEKHGLSGLHGCSSAWLGPTSTEKLDELLGGLSGGRWSC